MLAAWNIQSDRVPRACSNDEQAQALLWNTVVRGNDFDTRFRTQLEQPRQLHASKQRIRAARLARSIATQGSIMTTALFFDTETTSLPLWHEPSEAPQQPHIVQIAAGLVDIETRSMVAGIDLIVAPDGWTIPDDVVRVHGISTEIAQRYGVAELVALNTFLDLWSCADFRVAHNEPFVSRIVRIALKRFIGDDLPEGAPAPIADVWSKAPAQCTARLATPICAIPPTDAMRAARRFHHKTPNLAEAYRHFFNRDPERQHSAAADMTACMQIWFAIQDLQRDRGTAANDAGVAPSAA